MKVIPLEKCPVCKSANWNSLDYLRNKQYWFERDYLFDEAVGFKICRECGFNTYDYRDTADLNKHYKAERPVMRAGNVITCNRKNEYHKKFLKDIIKPEMKILDMGCAQGSFLDMLNLEFRVEKDNLFGTEWSDGFRAFAKHEYGLNVVEDDSEFKDKFDLISYYHVLEHIQHPDKELEKVKGMLTDDGLLYISVPIWFDILEEPSGAQTGDFENLFHMNHINVFSYQSFKNLLNQGGFEIIKENKEMYGYTVLCKLTNPEKKIIRENYSDIEKIIKDQKKAIEALYPNNPTIKSNPETAIKLYPKFPEAYISMTVRQPDMKDFETCKGHLEKGLNIIPDSFKIKAQLALLYIQWDEVQGKQIPFLSNNIKMAENILTELVERKPGDEGLMYHLAHIYGKYKKDHDKACEYYDKMMEINPSKFAEIWDKKALERLEQLNT